jgi:hypothetical protein
MSPKLSSAFQSTTEQAQLTRLPALCRDYIQPNQQSAGSTHQICGLPFRLKLCSLLRPVKDNLGLRTPGVYRVSCERGKGLHGADGLFRGHQDKGASKAHPTGTPGQVGRS